MYTFVNAVQFIATLMLIGMGFVFLRSVWSRRQIGEAVVERKRRVGRVATLVSAEDAVVSVHEAAQSNLRFLGLPSVHAGHNILNVPALDPGRNEGWDARRTVVTFSRIMALLPQGDVPGEFVELDGNYVLFATAGRSFILQAYPLTTSDEAYLEAQRQDAVDKGDGIIETFCGTAWKIGTACGSHTPRKQGGKRESTIQVLSLHPELGGTGIRSCLPPNLLDGKEHQYYDMRARTTSGEARVLFFFFAGGKWSCFMGRELTTEETDRLQAL